MNLTWLYVGVLYGIAVWITRRGFSEGAGKPAHSEGFPWRIAALFYLLVLIFLWRPMTGPYVNLPVDIVQTLPPWSNMTRDHRVANLEMNDIVMQIVPWAHQVRQAWKSFRFPLWNALSGSGYPLLANGQSSGLSPIRLLALPLPLGYSMTAEAAMKMLIALSFMFAFCRRRWSEIASAFGAVAFAWCTFVQTWLHFPLVTVAVFIPAAFLTVDLLFERLTMRRFSGAVAVWAVMLLGGHPETAAHICFLTSLYVLWIAWIEVRERPPSAATRLKPVFAFAAAVAVAAIIASPFLAPFMEALNKSKRYQELQARPNEIGYYSDFPSTVILFQPHFYGDVPFEKPWGPEVAESITGFAGVLGVAGWFALLLRAIMGAGRHTRRRFRDREMFFVIATVIVLGIVLGWPGISNAFHLIFSLAANARLRLLLGWLLAVTTAAAIDSALRERPLFLLAGAAICAAMLLSLMQTVPFPNAAAKDTAMLAIIPSLAVIALSMLFVFPGRQWAAMIVLVAVLAELWTASSGWNPVLPASRSDPVTPLIERLKQIEAATPRDQPFRIVGVGPALFPNLQAMFGFQDIRAHDPMANGRYLGVLRVVAKNYRTEDYFAKWFDTDTPFLDFLNVKYVVTDKNVDLHDSRRYRLIYDGKDGRIFQNADVVPRFFAVRNVILEFKEEPFVRRIIHESDWAHTGIVKTLPVDGDRMRQDLLAPRPLSAPEAKVSIVDASPTSFWMRVHAPRYTLIASSQPFWPGWQIRRDGTDVDPLPVDGAFLGFTIPPGDWAIHVYYFPATFYAGLAASLITIALLIALSIRSQRSRAAEPLRSE